LSAAAAADNDVFLSGYGPVRQCEEDEEEEDEEDYQTPAGIVMPEYAILSVDDFFDLDGAASAASPQTVCVCERPETTTPEAA